VASGIEKDRNPKKVLLDKELQKFLVFSQFRKVVMAYKDSLGKKICKALLSLFFVPVS
jgi:hypothetical protein